MKVLLARSVAAALAVFVAASCQTQDQEEPEATEPAATESSDREATLRPTVDAREEMWNTGDTDRLDTILAADFQRVAPDQSVEGIEGMKGFVRQARTAYPDFHIEFAETAYDDDLAFVHWTVTGTHTGEGSVPATGNTVDVSGITLLTFQDGVITREIVFYDTATLQAQLGAEGIPHVE